MQVRELESNPFFNAGRGSALTTRGTVEMEASIMDGEKRRCGAVSGVSTVKSAISLARLVMDKSPHSYLAFDGAEEFARQQVILLATSVFVGPRASYVSACVEARSAAEIRFFFLNFRILRGAGGRSGG